MSTPKEYPGNYEYRRSMSGHSKRATTKSIKALVDAKREKAFTEIGKEIKVAAKLGGDPKRDPRIGTVVAKAKSVNMFADDILIDKSIFEMLAEICKTLTNPKRIEILNILKNEEKRVTELVAALGASKATVSQHLAVMRHRGILATRRDGVNIYYRVTNLKIIDVCMLMKEILLDQHAKLIRRRPDELS